MPIARPNEWWSDTKWITPTYDTTGTYTSWYRWNSTTTTSNTLPTYWGSDYWATTINNAPYQWRWEGIATRENEGLPDGEEVMSYVQEVSRGQRRAALAADAAAARERGITARGGGGGGGNVLVQGNIYGGAGGGGGGSAAIQAEREAARLAREARNAARATAITRAHELLTAFLSEDQAATYRLHGHFEIIGSQGTVYRVCRGTSGNIEWLRPDGSVGGVLCAHPSMREHWLPDHDVHLAQMLALTTDERAWLAVANLHRGEWPPSRSARPRRNWERLVGSAA